ncbi:hypothetical protein D1872_220220 [compost metagenome]
MRFLRESDRLFDAAHFDQFGVTDRIVAAIQHRIEVRTIGVGFDLMLFAIRFISNDNGRIRNHFARFVIAQHPDDRCRYGSYLGDVALQFPFRQAVHLSHDKMILRRCSFQLRRCIRDNRFPLLIGRRLHFRLIRQQEDDFLVRHRLAVIIGQRCRQLRRCLTVAGNDFGIRRQR